jgi:hypothetical protein
MDQSLLHTRSAVTTFAALIFPLVMHMPIGDIVDPPTQESSTTSLALSSSRLTSNGFMLFLNQKSDEKPDPLCADECITVFNAQYICDLTCQYPSLKHGRILFNPGVIRFTPPDAK